MFNDKKEGYMKSKKWYYALFLCVLFCLPAISVAKSQSYREKLEVQHMRDLEPEEKSFFEAYDAYLEDGKIFQLNCFSPDIPDVDVQMYDVHGNLVHQEIMTFDSSGIGCLRLPEGYKVRIICWDDGKGTYISYLR